MECRRAPGTFTAEIDDESIVLDLAADKYWALGRLSTQLWSLLESNMPEDVLIARVADSCQMSVAEASALWRGQTEAWALVGLVDVERPNVDTDRRRALPRSRTLSTATHEIAAAAIARTPLSPVRLFHTAIAMAHGRRTLKTKGLATTIVLLQAIPAERRNGPEEDPQLIATVRAYVAMRRARSQGKEDCLDRSIGLAFALRRIGVDAHVCFGVLKFPMLAHAWVQVGSLVVNDKVAEVAKFTTIAEF